jgi:hypothetical protein
MLAAAYHESIALRKLKQHFDGPEAKLIAITAGTRCEKCGLTFAVVLSASKDGRNNEYLTRLDHLIKDDCRNGQHQQQYVLGEATPPFSQSVPLHSPAQRRIL